MRALIIGLLLVGPTANAQDAFPGNTAVSEEVLGGVTGRENVAVIASSTQTVTVAQNSISGISTTGTIAFDDNAFQNLAGFALINANTGNNVAISSSLSVSMTVTSP